MKKLFSFLFFVLLLTPVFAADYTAQDLQPIIDDLNAHPRLLNASSEMKISCMSVSNGNQKFTLEATDHFFLSESKCKLSFEMPKDKFDLAVESALQDNEQDAIKIVMAEMPWGMKVRLFFKCVRSESCRYYMNKFI